MRQARATVTEVHAPTRFSAFGARDARKPLVVRDGEMRDFSGVLTLWKELMAYHVARDPRFALSDNAEERFFHYYETARTREDYRVRIAFEGSRPVGFIVACILPNSPVYRARWIGYINDLGVATAMRGRGIGRRLVESICDWFGENGADSVEVYVAHRNREAQGFWRKMGAEDYLLRLHLPRLRPVPYPAEDP